MIYIITPCTRPQNLSLMQPTIPNECEWIIVYDKSVENKLTISGAKILDSPYTGHFGNSNRNYALNNLDFKDSDWIYILDDDNIIHPDWYTSVKEVINGDYNMITWGQLNKDDSIRLEPTSSPAPDEIDTACYMVRGKIMKSLRYRLLYEADGIMAKECSCWGNLLMLDQYLCYYNYLHKENENG